MLKHLKQAVRLSGMPLSCIEDHPEARTHPYIIVNGRTIHYARSPKNYDHAAMRIARDIKSVVNGGRP